MAIVNNVSLVKFGYGVSSKAVKEAGHITFASDTRQLFVGDGEKAVAFAGNVANAVFADKKLTITYNDGTASAVLDFSDVASAEGVSSLLSDLRRDVNGNATAIANLSTTVTNLDASYKAADTKIREDFAAADKAINDKIGTVADGKTVVELIADAKNAANAAHSVVAKDSSFLTLNTSTGENGAITYTLGTNDIASATTLADVKGRLDTFLNDADLNSTVDTLKEIQDWINGDGVNATELTEAIAAEAKLRKDADTSLGLRIDGVKATADAAAAKTYVDASLELKADKTQVASDILTAKGEAISAAADDATQKANTAESNAKAYADAITVNGQAQSGQNITVSGLNILVGGAGNHKDASLSTTVEDLYSKVDAASKAGVQSLAVNTDSSKYAEVSGATGAVTLTIKKVALADASNSNTTGVADAWDVKESIRVAKEGAISTVQGAEGDASTAATVAGAKAYADAQIEANALRWTVL